MFDRTQVKNHWSKLKTKPENRIWFHWVEQRCCAGTQISVSGSRSKNLKFCHQLWIQHLYVYGSSCKLIWSVERWKPLYYLYNSLAPQARAVEQEPTFQAMVPRCKFFGSTPAPTIQKCLGSGPKSLVENMISAKRTSTFPWKFKELIQLSFNKHSLNISSVHWLEINVKQFGIRWTIWLIFAKWNSLGVL